MMAVCFTLQVFPILILLVAGGSVPLYFLFAVLFGIGMGGEMTAFPIINRQYYGDAPTGTTYGWQMMGAGIGMALGPVAGGFLRDFTGATLGRCGCPLCSAWSGCCASLCCRLPASTNCPTGRRRCRRRPAGPPRRCRQPLRLRARRRPGTGTDC